MENMDALYARIAELEKENEKLKEETKEYEAVERFIMKTWRIHAHYRRPALHAHFRDGKVIDGEWVNDKFDEDEDEDTDDDDEDPDRCVKCDRIFNQQELLNDFDCAKAWELHCDMGDDEGDLCGACLQKWEDDNEEEIREHKRDNEDEDSDDEEEVLEDLTCAQLKTRLRAINKPVGGRKADLIQRIREHERLTAALFEED
jgi:hypothetical protein